MPHDRDALRVLVEKVRGATGPDRDLDAEIWWLFADHGNTNRAIMAWAGKRGVVYALGRFAGSTWRAQPWLPGYTASLDAALALALVADPDAEKMPAGEWLENAIHTLGAADGASFQGADPIGRLARAVLFCLLSDIIAQAESEAGGQHAQ